MYLLMNSALGIRPQQETYSPPWISQIMEFSGLNTLCAIHQHLLMKCDSAVYLQVIKLKKKKYIIHKPAL